MKKRLINKEDLQNHFKSDLVDEVLVNELVNKETKAPYEWEELDALSYDDIVNILVDSKKIYVVEL